jgi:hypothetical protein
MGLLTTNDIQGLRCAAFDYTTAFGQAAESGLEL